MSKIKKIAKLHTMLDSLSREHQFGGFNEYSQFCEERLDKSLYYLSESGLNEMIKDIENTSLVGITRRKPVLAELD